MRNSFVLALAAAFALTPALASRVHRAPTAGQPAHKPAAATAHSPVTTTAHKPAATAAAHKTGAAATAHRTVGRRGSRRQKGQQAILPDRVTQIQEALIREHYLTGDATGKWDAATENAMQKLQADNGWQTRLMPDSRALKKLGLGPDYSNAINAKDSSFVAPPPVSTIPASQAEGFATAARINQ